MANDDELSWPFYMVMLGIGILLWISNLRDKNRDLEMRCRVTGKFETYLGMSDQRRGQFMSELLEDLECYEKLAREKVDRLKSRRIMRPRKLLQVLKDWAFFSILGQIWNRFELVQGFYVVRLSESHYIMRALRERYELKEMIEKYDRGQRWRTEFP